MEQKSDFNIPTQSILPNYDNIFDQVEITTKDGEKTTGNYFISSFYDDLYKTFLNNDYNLTSLKELKINNLEDFAEHIECDLKTRGYVCATCTSVDDNFITKNNHFNNGGNFEELFGFIYNISNKIKCPFYGKLDIWTNKYLIFDKECKIKPLKNTSLQNDKIIYSVGNGEFVLKAIKNPDGIVANAAKHLVEYTNNVLKGIEKLKEKKDEIQKIFNEYKKVTLLNDLSDFFEQLHKERKVTEEIKKNFDKIYVTLCKFKKKDKFMADNEFKNIVTEMLKLFNNYNLLDMVEDPSSKENIEVTMYNDKILEFNNYNLFNEYVIHKAKNNIDSYKQDHFSIKNDDDVHKELDKMWQWAYGSNQNKAKQEDKYRFRRAKAGYHLFKINNSVFIDTKNMELLEPLEHNELALVSDILENDEYIFPIKSMIVTQKENVFFYNNYSIFQLKSIENKCIDIINFQMQKGLPLIYVKQKIDDSSFKIKGMFLSEFYAKCIELQGKTPEEKKRIEQNIQILKEYEKKQIKLIQQNNKLKDDKIFIELVKKLKEENKNKDDEKKYEVKAEEKKDEKEIKEEEEKRNNLINKQLKKQEKDENNNKKREQKEKEIYNAEKKRIEENNKQDKENIDAKITNKVKIFVNDIFSRKKKEDEEIKEEEEKKRIEELKEKLEKAKNAKQNENKLKTKKITKMSVISINKKKPDDINKNKDTRPNKSKVILSTVNKNGQINQNESKTSNINALLNGKSKSKNKLAPISSQVKTKITNENKNIIENDKKVNNRKIENFSSIYKLKQKPIMKVLANGTQVKNSNNEPIKRNIFSRKDWQQQKKENIGFNSQYNFRSTFLNANKRKIDNTNDILSKNENKKIFLGTIKEDKKSGKNTNKVHYNMNAFPVLNNVNNLKITNVKKGPAKYKVNLNHGNLKFSRFRQLNYNNKYQNMPSLKLHYGNNSKNFYNNYGLKSSYYGNYFNKK